MIVRQLSIMALVGIIFIFICRVSYAKTADVSVFMGKLAELPDMSLAITSTLNIVYFDTGKTVRYDIQEMQSSWQRRSKVHYRGRQPQERWQVEANLDDSGTFIVDESQVTLLSEKDNIGRTMCKQVDLSIANKLFNLNKLDGYNQQMHLIGAARILSLLGENLKLVKPAEALKKALLGPMRPIKDFVSFTFTYNQHTIVTHYSSDPAHNLAHGIPLELVVSPGDLASQNIVFFYDFRMVSALDDGLNLGDGSQASKQLLGKPAGGPAVDMFAIERAIGCSRVSEREDQQMSQASGHRLPPLKGLARKQYRFSFGAKPMLQNTESKATVLKVVYEPSIDTLRVSRSNELHRASTTTNYLTGLTYHMLDKRTRNQNIEKIVPSLGESSEKTRGDKPSESAPRWSCVVTKATTKAGEQVKVGGAAGASENPYLLGEMLLGVQPHKASHVRYLGLARVRGIDARMYELWNSTWPVWFQAPLVYHESRNWIGVSDEAKYWPSASGLEERETVWNTVFYLSGTGSDEPGGRKTAESKQNDLTSGNLLRIEMYELDTRTLRVRQRATFPIRDFAWHFAGASHSTGGERTEQFLSLADTCLSHDNNQYGRLDMLLTVPSEMYELTNWLRASSRRNFAIMQAAQQQMGLPASAIYDLETRLELGANKQTYVPVSFRTAERERAVNQLIYLGRGNFKSGQNELRKNVEHTLAYHFQACYLMVAHRRMDTVFAFRPADGRCYVYMSPVIGTVKQTVGGLFDMLEWDKPTGVTRATLQVYRVRHNGTPWSPDPPKSVLALMESRLGTLSSVNLLNSLAIDYDDGGQIAIKTKLASFQVNELDAKISPHAKPEQATDQATGEMPAAKFDTNKFEGLGLVASDETSTLIEPERPVSGGGGDEPSRLAKIVQVVNEMTFGQCQTQCLVDIDCGSFSWCIREGRAECVLSSVNFKQPALASQLIDLHSKRASKIGQIFTLKTKGSDQEAVCSRLQIRKHPTCELHNKQFMHLFRLSEPPKVRFDLAEMKLHPVGHRDDCAKVCLDRTLGVLKTDVGPAKEASLSALIDLTAETSERSLKKLFQEHKESHSKICTSFSFYDRANFLALGDAKMNRLARRVVSTQQNVSSTSAADDNSHQLMSESTGGYCLLGDLQTDAKRKQMDKEEATMAADARRRGSSDDNDDPNGRIVVTLEQFAFDFQFMFDKQYGVSLRKANVDADVEAALSAAVLGQQAHISAREFELLREFVRRGDNNVHWMSTLLIGGGPANCARLCFLQLVPLWPGCKSFAHVEREAMTSNQKITLCVFNTMSLRELLLSERSDLVRDVEAEPREPQSNSSQPRPPMTVWHYEPKPKFVSGSLDWSRAIETLSSDRLDEGEKTGGPNTGGVRLGSLGMFSCSLIGILLGVFLGLKIGEQTIGPNGSRAREDTQDLVHSIYGVEIAPGENGSQRAAGIEFSDLMAMDPAATQREHDNDATQ